VLFHEAHQRPVADDAGLHALHQPGAQFAVGQRAQHADIGKDRQRMMKAADKVLALGQVDAGLAAHGRIHLRQKRGGHLHIGNAAHVDRGQKAAHIAHNAAAKGNQERAAVPAARAIWRSSFSTLARVLCFSPGSRNSATGRLGKGGAEGSRPTAPRWKRVAELLVDVLAEGRSPADLRCLRRLAQRHYRLDSGDRKLDWIHLRHEETAAFAAGAEAHLTGGLAVCAGSCGPGNLHLINGLYDCHRSRVPVLAIAAQIPSDEIGSGYFQETHPEHLFAQCSHYCELVSQPEQMPRVLEIAMQTAISRRGVAVIAIPGDIALRDAVERRAAPAFSRTEPTVCPSGKNRALAKILNDSKKTTILAGAGCAGAHAELIELAGKLKAPIVHALRGKEFVEYDNPFDVGMTGLLGFSSGYHAMMNCDTLLMLGNGFPVPAVLPGKTRQDRPDRHSGRADWPPHQGRLGLVGDVKSTLAALSPKLHNRMTRT
jgi:hypothetical protein